MKYFAMTIIVFSLIMLWDGGLHAMDKVLATSVIPKKHKTKKFLIQESLERFNKAFQKTWDSYEFEGDVDPKFKISSFSGPAGSQQKKIAQWIKKDFRAMLWHTGDYDAKTGSKRSWCTDETLVPVNDADYSFVKLLSSSGVEDHICIDEKLIEIAECPNPSYPVTVLNIDTDISSLPEELFTKIPVQKPMTIVINEALILNGQVVQALHDKLKPLGKSYKAHKILQKLEQFKKEQSKRLFEDTNWPKNLQKEIDAAWGLYVPDCTYTPSVKLCFIDSLLLDQQAQCVNYWLKEIFRLQVESGKPWLYGAVDFGFKNRNAIKLISSNGVESILLKKEEEGKDFPVNVVTTIFSFDSNDKLLELPNAIKYPVVILVNEALLSNEAIVNHLSRYFMSIKDQDGALKCLEKLQKKCQDLEAKEKKGKTNKEEETKKDTAKEQSSTSEEKDSSDKRWFGASSILAHPAAKWIGILALAGSSIALLAFLSNYFKSSEKFVA